MKSLTPFDWNLVASHLPEIINNALTEDIGDGDVTSNATIPEDLEYHGLFLLKADGVMAGQEVVRETFKRVDERIKYGALGAEGSYVYKGSIIGEARGPARS